MKILITEEQKKLLTEVVTSIVYHITHLTNLYNILVKNKFILTSKIGSESDNLHPELFYLSTARSKHSYYVDTRLETYKTIIEINGNKINSRYKGRAIQYWDQGKNKVLGNNARIDILKVSEMEDRILSNKSEIPNAKSYINSISILLDFTNINDITFHNKMMAKVIKEIILICLREKIPLYFYKRKSDMLNGQVNKSWDIKKVIEAVKNVKKEDISIYTKDTEYNLKKNQFYFLIQLYKHNKFKDLSGETKNWLTKFLNDWNNDRIKVIKTIEHIIYSNRLNFRNKYYSKFVEIMRKNNNINISDFLDSLYDKWSKIVVNENN